MQPVVVPAGLLGAWLLVVAVLYWLFVPQALSMGSFLWVSGVLLVLVLVLVAQWRRSGPEKSIDDVLYDVEHQPAGRKP